MISHRILAAIILTLGLTAQAHAQTAAGTPSLSKPVAIKPGSGLSASVASSGWDCKIDDDGVSCTGTSGGSAGGGYGGGGGSSRGSNPGEGGRLPPGKGGGGSTGSADDAKEKAKERARAICHSNYQEDLEHISKVFNGMVEHQCGNLAQLKIGFKVGSIEGELDRIGAVIEELGRPFGRSCISIADETRNGAVKQKRDTRAQCLADAEKG